MWLRCYECGHEWDENRYVSHRRCPACREMIDIPDCKREYNAYYAARRSPATKAPPAKRDGPQPLPPIINEPREFGVIEEQDHSYLGHNEYKAVAQAMKRKRIDFPI